jgi:hypothetical protein
MTNLLNCPAQSFTRQWPTGDVATIKIKVDKQRFHPNFTLSLNNFTGTLYLFPSLTGVAEAAFNIFYGNFLLHRGLNNHRPNHACSIVAHFCSKF